jgi:hypothetical protein
MTLVDFYNAKEPQLRKRLETERDRLKKEIEAAALSKNQDEVDRLSPESDAVMDDLNMMDAIELNQIIASRIVFPELPADFSELLQAGDSEVQKWQKVEAAITKTIDIAGQVATGVSKVAVLIVKYGKYLV